MLWVFVFVGIALVGLVMVIAYAVWLAHLAADVLNEVGVLADRGGQLADLLGQIQAPEPQIDATGRRLGERVPGVHADVG